MRHNKAKSTSVLLEHGTGVMEVFFSVKQTGSEVSFRPLGSVPRSGSTKSTDREALIEALRLVKWCEDHPQVFDGEVVADADFDDDLYS